MPPGVAPLGYNGLRWEDLSLSARLNLLNYDSTAADDDAELQIELAKFGTTIA